MDYLEHQGEQHCSLGEDRLSDATAPVGGTTSALLQLEALYRNLGQYEQHAVVLRQLLDRDLAPEQKAELLLWHAHALYCQFRFDESIAQAEKVLDEFPDFDGRGSALSLLGAMYSARASWQHTSQAAQSDALVAQSYLERALEELDDPQDRAAALTELGAALNTSGHLAKSRLVLQQALDIGIEDPITAAACCENLGRTLLALGHDEEARLYYERSALAYPDEPNNARATVYVVLAQLYLDRAEPQRAEECCQQAWQALDQSSPRTATRVVGHVHNVLGDLSFGKGDYQQAAEHYQTALEQDQYPDEQRSLYGKLGQALAWTGQGERALASLRQALALTRSAQPQDEASIVGLLWDMGRMAYRVNDYQQAADLLQELVGLVETPVAADANLLLGHSYFALQRYSRAASAYEQVVQRTGSKSVDRREAKKYLRAAKRLQGSRR